MRERIKMKNIKKLTVMAGLLFAASLLPLLLLGRYNVMCYDDYLFGAGVRDAFLSTGSVTEALMEGVKHANNRYMQWQGYWIITFLSAVYPANFHYQLAFIVPIISIGLFAPAVFCAGKCLLTKWLGGSGKEVTFALLILLFLFYQVMDSPFEGLYWYNGMMTYMIPQACLFFAAASVTKALWAEKKGTAAGFCVIASLCAVFSAEGNFITALQTEILLLLIVVYTGVKKRKKLPAAVIPWLFGTISFLFNILAPGNAVRSATDGVTGNSPVKAVILSFYHAIIYMIQWTPAIVLLVFLALLPVLWQIAKKSQHSFRYPLWVTLGAYCLLSAMFTPTLYAVGEAGQPRTNNIIQMVYYLCLLGVITYWLGWASHQKAVAFRSEKGELPTVAVLLIVFVIWGMTMDKNTYTSISALRSLVKGEGAAFYEESMERYALYMDEEIQDVVLKPYSQKPALFAFEDLSTEPGNWVNMAVRAYYHKTSVVMGGKE